ncbi:uncharacterized protein TM35_000301490 [Trypanosoma theileri]|uniref:C3H1-type domain-containing protein n=1 Tax=Trypanosoma theileri TaxID=67003 RepID=A0A1X0NPJ7_9TRYP|nr:uncharacterized protein TM35_000301490 [Trypanosoma theileri]ORC86109.1 hypothetical protein TM35_000301490 [Trypanosoma theileri]
MAASNSIFLYITEGRTLWVPGHTPAPGENKPVHILNFATPRELSRSFYLFDMPIQLVQDAQTAAMIPGGKTPEDVIIAVNEFRRVCTEDQDFLLRRCYDANKPPPPQQQQQPQPQPQQAQQQQQMVLAGGGGIGDSFALQQNPSLNVAQTNPNQAFLLQLLQQQQQQRMAMMPQVSPLQQPPPMTFNRGPMMGVGGSMMMNNGGMMMPPNLPMMPNNNNSNYGNPMMSFGRGAGLMPAPNNTCSVFPAMGPGSMQTMVGGRGMGRGGRMMNNAFQAPVREQPEPLPVLAPIPDDILEIYMNPQHKLMCATMPGPRCTVWLREYEIPTDTRNPRYVFCKGGIVLMLKTKGTEIEKSKPVELFEQQVCAHFLIHNYCSRTNCLHRHHTEAQLRQLIASKHVELKSMTKKERHRLSELVLEKDREGLARAAEDREQRAKERMEQAKRREAAASSSSTTTNNTKNNTNDSKNNDSSNNKDRNKDDNTTTTIGSTDGSRTLPMCGHVGGSDDEDESANGNDDKTNTNGITSNGSSDKKDISHKSGEKQTGKQENKPGNRNRADPAGGPSRRSAPFSSRRVQSTVDIGVTDSEDDDDDDDDSSSSASSSSSSSSSSSNSSKRINEVVNKENDKEKKEKEVEEVEETTTTTTAISGMQSTEAHEEKDAAHSETAAVSMEVTAEQTAVVQKEEEKEEKEGENHVEIPAKNEKANNDHKTEKTTVLKQHQKKTKRKEEEKEEGKEKEKEKEGEKKISVVVEENKDKRDDKNEEEKQHQSQHEEEQEEEEEEQEQQQQVEVMESSDAVNKPDESENEEETNAMDEKRKKAKPRGKNGAAKHGRSKSPKRTVAKSKRTRK